MLLIRKRNLYSYSTIDKYLYSFLKKSSHVYDDAANMNNTYKVEDQAYHDPVRIFKIDMSANGLLLSANGLPLVEFERRV